jgi:hypothetical protein
MYTRFLPLLLVSLTTTLALVSCASAGSRPGGEGGDGGGEGGAGPGPGSGGVGGLGGQGGEGVGGQGGQGGGAGGQGGEGGEGGAGGAGGEMLGAVPPGPGPLNSPDGSGSATFTMSKLFLGDTNRDGTVNKANGWKQYGFNIDGKISTSMSADLCKPRKGANPNTIYPDGENGIDNSFGRNILPIFLAAAPDFSTSVNESILEGDGTVLMELQKLGAGANYNPMTSQLFGGADLGKQPAFDGTDVWPVDPDTVASAGPPLVAKLSTLGSYLTQDTWVAQVQGSLNLYISMAGGSTTLPIINPVFVMTLDASHVSATNGTVSGVLGVEAFKTEFKKFITAFDVSFCEDNATVDSILTQIEQAADIMIDGSQDPTKECDAISIGLGFNAARVELGGVGASKQIQDPCPP